jgi:hypothetical protein
VNYAPTFTAVVPLIEVDEDSPAYSRAWATNISAGPGDEEDVTLSIACVAAGDLFSAEPAISNTGVLTFTPSPQVSGSTNCTVTLSEAGDNGKTAEAELTIVIRPGAAQRRGGYQQSAQACCVTAPWFARAVAAKVACLVASAQPVLTVTLRVVCPCACSERCSHLQRDGQQHQCA